MDTTRTIVVGGGLAGLTAAATLARDGMPVTVVEGAAHLGGRARSRHRDGYDINLGPHALYRTGGGLAVLRRLGVPVRGKRPRLSRAGVYVRGEIAPAAADVLRHVGHRARLTKAMTGLGPRAATAWAGRPTDDWIAAVTDDPAGQAVLASLVRTSTYSADTCLLDAGAATMQLRVASHGVLYLDHGWSSLVAGLAGVIPLARWRDPARHERRRRRRTNDRADGVRLVDGRTLGAAAVVLAVNDPRKAAGLLTGDAAARIGAVGDASIPVRMAHLDVALRPLPSSRFPNVLGIDEPIFVTVPSDVADVAPAGGGIVQVARYLRPGEERLDHRAGLEAVLNAHQPGWRDDVVDARYVPRSPVTGDHARVATHGVTGRATARAAGVERLALAGDWIGPTGMLGDAAILSGAAAAAAVRTDMLEPVSRSHARS